MQKINPCLWFGGNAEQAAKYYVSIFPNSKITGMNRHDESSAKASGMPKGSVLTVSFRLAGQEFVALNGGPEFKFTEAVSLVVNCESQKEIDYYWAKLSAGGDRRAQMCGWLKDKYGLSWQVVPKSLDKLLSGDPKKSGRAMAALMKMKKLDIGKLEEAYRKK